MCLRWHAPHTYLRTTCIFLDAFIARVWYVGARKVNPPMKVAVLNPPEFRVAWIIWIGIIQTRQRWKGWINLHHRRRRLSSNHTPGTRGRKPNRGEVRQRKRNLTYNQIRNDSERHSLKVYVNASQVSDRDFPGDLARNNHFRDARLPQRRLCGLLTTGIDAFEDGLHSMCCVKTCT